GRLCQTVWLVALVWFMAKFALPAGAELLERGYHAAPEAMQLPEFHPVVRLILKVASPYGTGPAPGQARLEFNIIVRQFSAAFTFVLVLVVAGAAAEGLITERERDTWPGLLATPLTGTEILRAKMLGAFWKAREVILWIVASWVAAVLTGALHPL